MIGREPEPLADDELPFRRRVRHSIARLRHEDRYGLLVLLVAASIAFQSLAPERAWATVLIVLIQASVLLLALWSSQVSARRMRFYAWVTGILLGPALVAGLVHNDRMFKAVAALVSGLFVALAPISVIRAVKLGVRATGRVTVHTALGAVCVYLLIGMMFSFAYGVLAQLHGSLFAQPGVGDGTMSTRLYFSFVTLTTVGYGDLTPTAASGRTLAILEALTGQLYLVIVIAVIVANVGRPVRGIPDTHEDRDEEG